jgi:RND family efflux transporter MFP subunit
LNYSGFSLKIVLPILVLLTTAGVSWAIFAFRPQPVQQASEASIPKVEVIKARPQTVKLNVHSQGIVTPREEIDLVAEVSGKVVQIHPALVAGGFFAANELLLTVDTRDYDYAIIAAEARIAEAKRVLIAEQAQVEQANSEWQALGEGEASELALRKPQLAEAQAKLQAAIADLAKAKLNRSRCELRAPFTGRVLKKQVGLGQFIPTGTVVARIYASEVSEIRLPISTEQLAFLNVPLAMLHTKIEQWPKVSLSAEIGGQQHQWQGHIVRSEAAVDESSGQWTLVAQVADPFHPVANHPPLLKGLFVQADIEGKELADVYRLPRSAVSPMRAVKLVDAQQRLEIRQVEWIRTEADFVIINSGLKPGEQVIVSELPVLVAGMKVAVDRE